MLAEHILNNFSNVHSELLNSILKVRELTQSYSEFTKCELSPSKLQVTILP